MGCAQPKKEEINITNDLKIDNSMNIKKHFEYKIVLLGLSNVGKTSIVVQYVTKKFNEKHVLTLGGTFIQKRYIFRSEDTVYLNIWDTGGSERYRALASLYYKGANAAILVYDITDENSLKDLTYWIKQLSQEVETKKMQLVLAGNKLDLAETNRKIPYEQGQKFADENSIEIFYEVSAKKGQGIDEMFETLVKKLFNSSKSEKIES